MTPEVIPENFVPEDSYKDYSKQPRLPSGARYFAIVVTKVVTFCSDAALESVVRLRGLPWQATDADIRNFFAPLTIAPNGVHTTLNNQGRLVNIL